jgi:trimeric autotransporter adhesin
MKSKYLFPLGAAFCSFLTAFNPAFAQSNAFTYQGRLDSNGGAASGSFDFRFRLASDALGSNYVVSPLLTNAVPVSNGLFTVILDFGAGIFTGSNFWLQVDVKTNGASSYTALTPLQAITPTPYAITASSLSGTLPATQLRGTVASANLAGAYVNALTLNNAANSLSGSGAGLTALNASELTSGTVSDARLAANVARTHQVWLLAGNAGTAPGTHFVGTTDNQPLELRVNSTRALRLEPNAMSPNVIGGYASNSVSPGFYGATIAGGGLEGLAHTISAHHGTIGGGVWNTVTGEYGTIAGGGGNVLAANYASIGGGLFNSNLGSVGTIAGGRSNTIQFSADIATISGGYRNAIQASAGYATIGGGIFNKIQTNAFYTTLGGGYQNTIQTNAVVGTIGGGQFNTIQSSAASATIGGGSQNTIAANADYATIPGGCLNTAARYAFAAGFRAKAYHFGSFVWADSQDADFASTANDQFNIRAAGGVRLSDSTPQLSFGQTTRQMITLYDSGVNSTFGIGVQSSTLYQRAGSGSGFAWFSGGAHNNAQNNPGASAGIPGTVLMRLDANGNLVIAGAYSSSSDRNVKTNFATVSACEILEKVISLPISTWAYKQDGATKHMGPMAQDFHAAFALGTDDKHIASVDADGVALAAIQGLNQKFVEQEARLMKKDSEIQELRTAVASLEKAIRKIANHTEEQP